MQNQALDIIKVSRYPEPMIKASLQGTIRWDSRQQLKRYKLAAAKMHWSLNRFLLVAGEEMANRLLGDSQSLADAYTAAEKEAAEALERLNAEAEHGRVRNGV